MVRTRNSKSRLAMATALLCVGMPVAAAPNVAHSSVVQDTTNWPLLGIITAIVIVFFGIVAAAVSGGDPPPPRTGSR